MKTPVYKVDDSPNKKGESSKFRGLDRVFELKKAIRKKIRKGENIEDTLKGHGVRSFKPL